MENYFYKVIIEPCAEGGFTALIPKLPGCVSDGDTYEECLANIKEAAALYLETVRMNGNKIIIDDTQITEMCIAL